MSNATAEIMPPWGALPSEQYLIRHWDPSSLDTAAVQRRKLIHAFLALDAIPEEWDTIRGSAAMTRVPTAAEVHTILAPWRPLRWRRTAVNVWRDRWDHAVWLRTHYPSSSDDGEEVDEKFKQWIAADEDADPSFDPDTLEWRILDDSSLFAFGNDWDRVFDLLPELAGPAQGHSRWRTLYPEHGEEVQRLRAELKENVRTADEDVESVVETGPEGMKLQELAVDSFLIVADAEAWETDLLRILFLDTRGNIVRHSRIAADEVNIARVEWEKRQIWESQWWLDAAASVEYPHLNLNPGGVLGERYRVRGEMGRMLYDVEDLL